LRHTPQGDDDEVDVNPRYGTWTWILLAALIGGCTSAPQESRKTRTPHRRQPAAAVTPQAPMPMAASARIEPARVDAPSERPADYDLAADRERIREKVARDLGARSRVVVVAEQYVVGAPAGTGAVESAAPFMDSVLAALHNGRFRARPPRALAVYLFPEAGSYEAFCRAQFAGPCMSRFGFFSPAEGALVMNIGLGIGTLSHELVHPILAADFPQAPTWINEGIASLYEAPVLPRRGEIHGRKNWRHPRLVAALSSQSEREEAALHNLFGLSDEAFRGAKEDLHYATARYTCQWLDDHGKLWEFYQGWRDGYSDDRTGERAFTRAVGRSPEEANHDWTRWVLSL